MFLFMQYPSWITPEIIPGFPLFRWYGLMYLFAFATAYLLFRRQVRNGELQAAEGLGRKVTDDDVIGFFTWGIFGLLIGARIFATLVYDTTGDYWHKPWLIFWPFKNGVWSGFQGMSYHGGFIGGLVGTALWCLKNKRPLLAWTDAMTASIPLGFTFGRIGNFLNGELFGRATASPLGMVFPNAELLPLSNPWIHDIAQKIGMAIPAGARLINLPRHPSQLYEAFFEGIALWAVIWFVFRKKKPFNGFITAIYTIGYGLVRFVIEYFREPDADIGYRITAGAAGAPTYLNESLLNFSTGQILCFIMIAGGTLFLVVRGIRERNVKR
ncbi:MAG TPA: prolipoprotein diacylglyceryl transferase [Treponemataceae bacterium]|nr:prolipoprotein diacylglyceryl transferase [Treponemataceae bacterium]